MLELQLHPVRLWKETLTPQEWSLQKGGKEGAGATQTPTGLQIEFGIMGLGVLFAMIL